MALANQSVSSGHWELCNGQGEPLLLSDLPPLKFPVHFECKASDDPCEPVRRASDPYFSIRVACASSTGEELDGHFGSCPRFLVYQVDAVEIRLIDVRATDGPDARDDKNAYRASLISDCQVLFVASIGGPAAAKVIKIGVYPIKHLTGGNARERVAALQTVLATAPPPWLAKVMGQDEESRVRFERSTES